MLSNIIALLVGGAIGVLCDRLWQKVEKRVQLNISCSYERGTDGEALVFKIRNDGKETLPPIRIGLRSGSGTYYVFPAVDKEADSNGLWPGQEREFGYRSRFGPVASFDTMSRIAEAKDTAFIVQPVGGEAILFCSQKIGRTLAALFAKTDQGVTLGNISGQFWRGLSYDGVGPIAWLRQKYRLRMLLRQVNQNAVAGAGTGKKDAKS